MTWYLCNIVLLQSESRTTSYQNYYHDTVMGKRRHGVGEQGARWMGGAEGEGRARWDMEGEFRLNLNSRRKKAARRRLGVAGWRGAIINT